MDSVPATTSAGTADVTTDDLPKQISELKIEEPEPLFDLPWPPPSDCTVGQFYGWEIDNEWLVEVAKDMYTGDLSKMTYHTQFYAVGIKMLRQWTGMRNLDWRIVYPAGEDPEWTTRPVRLAICIVASSKRSYKGRATVSQYRKLRQFFLTDPEWLVDAGFS